MTPRKIEYCTIPDVERALGDRAWPEKRMHNSGTDK